MLKQQYVFIFVTQGQEVGRQNHDIRMVCIEKEIEMARSIGVSVFLCRTFFKEDLKLVTKHRY